MQQLTISSSHSLISSAKKNQRVLIKTIETPLGGLTLGATDRGLCFCGFTNQKHTAEDLLIRPIRFNLIEEGDHPYLQWAEEQIQEYFNGQRTDFTIPLDLQGTNFQQKVWQELQRIPYGLTRSYQTQATAVGNSKAVRAVANANGRNPICIIIPCHRVIGSNGSLTGYSAGLERKQWLLNHEMTNNS